MSRIFEPHTAICMLFLVVALCNADEEEVKVEYITKPQSFEKTTGQDVRLPCQIRSASTDVIKIWVKNDVDVLFAGAVEVIRDTRISLDKEDSLIIKNINLNDAGTYTCRVNTKATPNSITHRLVLLGPPAVKTIPENGDIVVKEGSPVEFSCLSHSAPTPKITWKQLNHTELDVNTLASQDGKVKITAAERIHSGTFECKAENGYGEPARGYITLKVLGKPSVSLSLAWSGPMGGKQTADLTCLVSSDSIVKVFWRKGDGSQVSSSGNVEVGTKGSNTFSLKIKDVSKKDFSNYSCVASNNYGEGYGTIEISANPLKPIVTTIPGTDPTTHSVTLSTITPFKVIRFLIKFRRANADGPFKNITINVGENTIPVARQTVQYRFTNLEIDTAYNAFAVAENENGVSAESDFSFRTPKLPAASSAAVAMYSIPSILTLVVAALVNRF